MNVREDYLVVCELPYEVTMTFGKSGAPDKKQLDIQFRRLGSPGCLARVPVHTISGKKVTIRLPETLACYGEGRYELVIVSDCQECDRVEIWFEADCEIVSIEGKEPDACVNTK